jgi:hypothetical protein
MLKVAVLPEAVDDLTKQTLGHVLAHQNIKPLPALVLVAECQEPSANIRRAVVPVLARHRRAVILKFTQVGWHACCSSHC